MKLEDNLELLRKSHGRRVTCEIGGTKITDAKISVCDDRVYICQNKVGGSYNYGRDKFGYTEVWLMEDDVKNLRFSPLTLRDIQVGDTVIDCNGDERRVLAVCGDIFAFTYDDVDKDYSNWVTFARAERDGWKVKEEPEESVILSMDEIAKKFGIPVEKLKIKKED